MTEEKQILINIITVFILMYDVIIYTLKAAIQCNLGYRNCIVINMSVGIEIASLYIESAQVLDKYETCISVRN